MAPKYCSDTQAAVKEMNGEGMHNVHFLDITGSSVGANASYMGCAGHPCVALPFRLVCASFPAINNVLPGGWQFGNAMG